MSWHGLCCSKEADSIWFYIDNPIESWFYIDKPIESPGQMLRFAEEIILLLLDDDGKEFVRMPMWSMRTVFAASVLMDLALENRIDTDLDRLFPVDPRPLQDDLLDPTLTRIAGAEIHDTSYWLERIAEHGEDIRERALTRLVERGILRHRGNPSPWTFRSRRYPIADGKAQGEAKARILRVLSAAEIPAPRDIALICLADACGLFDRLLSGKEAARAAARLEQVRRMDLIGRTLSRAVWDIRATLVTEAPKKPLIGLALGAGAVRGWAHIGAIQCLAEAGIVPDIVCGTSAGALVGGFYAAGKLDILEEWARNLTLGRLADYMTISPGRSLFGNRKFFRELAHYCQGAVVDKLSVPFAAVTTELATGQEIWLRNGPLLRAVSASMAYPGLFPPVKIENRWMIDGTLVNPVPVSACRALGARLVIAVSLNQDRPGKTHPVAKASGPLRRVKRQDVRPSKATPSVFSMMKSLVRRTRTPRNRADMLIRPRFNGVVLPGSSQAEMAITEGRKATERALHAMGRLYSALA